MVCNSTGRSRPPTREVIAAILDVAKQAYRGLKPGKHAVILMGDTRKGRHYVPIAARVMQAFLEGGFLLKEDVIKVQHNTKGTPENWKAERYDFHKTADARRRRGPSAPKVREIAHEYLFVFRKPEDEEDAKEHKLSRKWW